MKILDAGCGTGSKTLYLSQIFPNAMITAIDFNEPSLEHLRYACDVCDIENITIQKADLTIPLPFENERFDHIFSLGVLLCLPDPGIGLKHITKCLKKGGYLSLYLYNQWGRTDIILFNKLVLNLTNNDPQLKEKVIRNFSVDAKKQMWFKNSLLDFIQPEKRAPKNSLVRDILPPVLFRKIKAIRNKIFPPIEVYHKYNNWDLFAHPVVHLYDVASVYDFLAKENLEILSIQFRSNPEISDLRAFLKETLSERNLEDCHPVVDAMENREIYETAETLLRPNAFNLNCQK